MAAVALPQEVVLRSKYNGRYLEYVTEEGKARGFLRFGLEDSTSPQSKFQVEPARGDSQLVHLKSCYNNKYLRAAFDTTRWIIPGADGPEEDQSKWSCTLFRPVPVGGDDFRFMHVRTGNYVAPTKMEGELDNCLFAELPHQLPDLSDVVTVIEWRSLMVLPRHVAFKGDNGNYLIGQLFIGKHFLRFTSPNSGDQAAVHEVFQNPDGTIRLKSIHFDRFWRVDPSDQYNWVLSDSEDTTNNDKNTLFWPVKIDDNVVALRSLGNDLFCRRLIAHGILNSLSAIDPTVSRFAPLHVTDLT